MVYVISRLWTDPMENNVSDAYGYKVIGYTPDLATADRLSRTGGVAGPGDCWAITKQLPRVTYQKLEEVR